MLPRIEALILGGTLTLPPLCGGPLPLPGRERGFQRAKTLKRTLSHFHKPHQSCRMNGLYIGI
ncbi:hypothetical protein FW320_15105 [Azospirillum sp. Vi22]|nr:hypothetical protein [Azospirillum baldaniorum]